MLSIKTSPNQQYMNAHFARALSISKIFFSSNMVNIPIKSETELSDSYMYLVNVDKSTQILAHVHKHFFHFPIFTHSIIVSHSSTRASAQLARNTAGVPYEQS